VGLFIQGLDLVGCHNVSLGGSLNAGQILLGIEALALILQILLSKKEIAL